MDYIYYWYDHLILRNNGDAKEVDRAIRGKDFDAFMKIKKKYLRKEYNPNKWLFFPDVIRVWDAGKGIVGELDVNVRENFNKITHHEFECG